MSNKGWTLIELLVAICISAIICIGMMQFYLFSRQAYRLLQQTARLQENGRVATHMLQQDLRSAGFAGCMQLNRLPALVKTAIRGDNGFLSALPIFARKLPYTNAIFLQKLNTQLVNIRKVDQNSIGLQQMPEQLFKTGDKVLISDCRHVEIFQIAEIDRAKKRLLLQYPLQYHYAAYAQVGKLMRIVYFIADTGRNAQGETIKALYRADLNMPTAPTEVIEGVADMQISYGISVEAGLPLNYQAADGVSDWSQVRSVNIQLLLQGTEAISTEPVKFTFAGQARQSRLLNLPWSITIALREFL